MRGQPRPARRARGRPAAADHRRRSASRSRCPPAPARYELVLEDGTRARHARGRWTARCCRHRRARLPPARDRRPARPRSPSPRAAASPSAPRRRPWALAVQLYALRRAGDAGLGDFRALRDLVAPAAAHGAAGIAISPVHAQFSADPDRFSPYSPSSRHHAERAARRARLAADAQRPARARAAGRLARALRAPARRAARRVRRRLARRARGARRVPRRTWATRSRPTPASKRCTPSSSAEHRPLALAHLAGGAARPGQPGRRRIRPRPRRRGRASTPTCSAAPTGASPRRRRRRATAGMPIGLIADLAVGADSGGSHCWSRQDGNPDRPVDRRAARPAQHQRPELGPGRVLAARPARRTASAPSSKCCARAMRHAGGVRIDHALGLRRLWVVPDGARPREGAYLAFPQTDLLRLIALESQRHRAIVLGEDLGTIPRGLPGRAGRRRHARHARALVRARRRALHAAARPGRRAAAAMTSTHDLPTLAGWWAGRDLEWRAKLGLAGDAGKPGAGGQRARSATASRSGTPCATAAPPQGDPPPDDDARPFADAATAPRRPAPPATSPSSRSRTRWRSPSSRTCPAPWTSSIRTGAAACPARPTSCSTHRRRRPRSPALAEASDADEAASPPPPACNSTRTSPSTTRPRWSRISTSSASAISTPRRC